MFLFTHNALQAVLPEFLPATYTVPGTFSQALDTPRRRNRILQPINKFLQ
jgi:hypothetical protein